MTHAEAISGHAQQGNKSTTYFDSAVCLYQARLDAKCASNQVNFLL